MIRIHSIGPRPFQLYWGIETGGYIEHISVDDHYEDWQQETAEKLVDQSWLTWSWMAEDQEPWRVSRRGAFRVRLPGQRALHIGVCKRGDPNNHELSSEDYENFSPHNIGRWNS